jgi:hypothetical protein
MALARLPMARGMSLSEADGILSGTEEKLGQLSGGQAKLKGSGEGADLVTRERTFKMTRFLPGTESAEFYVLLTADGKGKGFHVSDVQYISGSEKMKAQGTQLKGVEFGVPAPNGAEARFVRRGILGCYQYSGCSFVLLDIGAGTQAVN